MTDTTLYLERSKVREILIGQPDENLHITEHILFEVDALPIVTAEDMRDGDAQAAPSDAVREALELARKRIEYFGEITTQRHQEANEQYFLPPIDNALAALTLVSSTERGIEPIPPGIYFDPDAANFYSVENNKGCGLQFYGKWRDRLREFPQSRDAAVVPSNHPRGGE